MESSHKTVKTVEPKIGVVLDWRPSYLAEIYLSQADQTAVIRN